MFIAEFVLNKLIHGKKVKNSITYDQIHPLVQYVEIVSGVVQCHFLCPVKSKKIVAITGLSKLTRKVTPQTKGFAKGLIKYFSRNTYEYEMQEPEFQKENAIIHAFEKISERFVWSDEHKHFIYKF